MRIGNPLPLAVLCALGLLCAATVAQAQGKGKDGWVNLLPKGNYSTHWTTKGNWETKEGYVTLTPRPGEKGWDRFDAYLWSDKQYDDFEVKFDYKVEKSGNSGFYFNVGDKSSPVAKGIEVQIYDTSGKGADAKLTDHDSGGIIPGIPPTKAATKPAGEWNHFDITVRGNQLTVKLNGEVVNEVSLDNPRLQGRPDSGYIGFQDHAMPLSLRNIYVRELPKE